MWPIELLGRKGPRRGGTRRSAVRSLMGLGNGPESPIHSNENGTVLERLFLLRGLFVEIAAEKFVGVRLVSFDMR